MKRCGRSSYNIRPWTPRDERNAQRQGGYNYGMENVILDDELEKDWEEFVEELFAKREPVDAFNSESDDDATATVRSQSSQ